MICLHEKFRTCLKSPDVSRRIWNHRVQQQCIMLIRLWICLLQLPVRNNSLFFLAERKGGVGTILRQIWSNARGRWQDIARRLLRLILCAFRLLLVSFLYFTVDQTARGHSLFDSANIFNSSF
jgi:hypothetical protein